MKTNRLLFLDDNKNRKIFGSTSLNLEDGNWVEIIRKGNWMQSYNEFEIKLSTLKDFVRNFKDNVLRYSDGKIPFNYRHDRGDKAAGWIEDLKIVSGRLLAMVNWTSEAKKSIEDGEWKHISSEIDWQYKDQETGEVTKNVLLGAALTNIPFVRGMKAVALSEVGDGISENDIFIFNNSNLKMDTFKKMLSILKGKKDISLAEVELLKGQMEFLSDEEQAEVKEDVEKAEEVASENAEVAKEEEEKKEAELAEKEKEITKLKDGVSSLSSKEKAIKKLSEDLVKVQTVASEQQSIIDKMREDARKTELAGEVEALIRGGQIVPAQSKAILDFCLTLSDKQLKAQLDIYKAMPKRVDLSEIGDDASDPADSDVIAMKKVKELQDAGDTRAKAVILAEVYSKMD